MELEYWFVNFPELHAIMIELVQYSEAVAIPVSTVVIEDNISTSGETVYPIVITTVLALQIMMRLFKNISFSYILRLMGKHRLIISPIIFSVKIQFSFKALALHCWCAVLCG